MAERKTFLLLKGGKVSMDTSLDSFEGIADSYLKASDLKENKGFLIVENVDLFKDDLGTKLKISINYEGNNFKLILNVTNTKKIKEFVKSPRELIGKRINWEKIRVRNPNTQQMQDGISVLSVE